MTWLDAQSSGRGAPPAMGSESYPPIADAPGQYVHQR
jgi:poly(3-hydroxyalkanoate) synthetase